jgi:hypothetical protein
MSAPVDLLGDLNRAIAGMEGPVRERRGHRDRLIDVRAAVAELVAAGRNCEGLLSELQEGGAENPELEELRTALARFGGAA